MLFVSDLLPFPTVSVHTHTYMHIHMWFDWQTAKEFMLKKKRKSFFLEVNKCEDFC